MSLSACILSRLYREVADKPTYMSDVQETNQKGRSQTSLTSRPEHVEQVTSTFILIDFSLTEKAVTLIFISGCGSVISPANQGKSGSIYNIGKN